MHADIHVVQYGAGDTETLVEERGGGQKALCQDTPHGRSKLQQTTEIRLIRLHFLSGGYFHSMYF